MKIDVYKSTKSSKYLVVEAGRNIAELIISDADMAEVFLFKKNIVIDLNKPLVSFGQEDAIAALAAIKTNGYYMMNIDIQMTVK
jgi:hypothetical protein